MNPLVSSFTQGHGITLFGVLVALAIVWSLIFKGIALWYAARNHQKRWFVVLLILNTLGILDIVYLLWFRADRSGTTPSLFNTVEPADHASES